MTLQPYTWSKQAARDPGKMDQELQKIQRTTQSIIDDISGGGGPVTVTRLTFSEDLYSITSFATPAAFAVPTFDAFLNSASGATLMGRGTVGDVSLKNRAGTTVLSIDAGTTNVTLAGGLTIGGTVAFASTTDSTSPTTGAVTVAGGVGIAKALFVGTTVNAGTALTYTTSVGSTTALATPSAFVATRSAAFASTANGASLMGFGVTYDVALLNQAGTVVFGILSGSRNIEGRGPIYSTGVDSQFGITRRDSNASAWAIYSDLGSLQFYSNAVGVDKFTMTSGGNVAFVSAAAAGFAVGPNGASNPAFQLDTSVGSLAAGLKVTGAVAAGTVAVAVISSGSNANLSVDAKGSGTITLGGTSTGAFTFTRASTFTNGITNAGTIAAGVWNGTTILTTFGGTGLASYTAGDLVYWASGTTFTKLGIGTAGQFLRSTGTAPAWTTATFPAGATAGDLLYGSASNVWTALAIGSSNAILQVSGGFPAWTLTPAGLTSIGATTGTFTNVGGTLTTVSQPNVTTMAALTTIGTLVAGAVPASLVTTGTFPGVYTVTGVLTLTAQPILSSLTASLPVFTDASKGLVSNAMTGTGSVVMSASPTLTGTVTTAVIAASGDITISKASPRLNILSTSGVPLVRLDASGGQSYFLSVGAGTANALELYDNTVGAAMLTFAVTTSAATFRAGAAFAGAVSGITTLGASGKVTLTASGVMLERTGATTNATYLDFASTGGRTYMGSEVSTGGAIITGSSAYATILSSGAAVPLELGTNTVARLSISSAGAFDFKSNPLSGITTLTTTGRISNTVTTEQLRLQYDSTHYQSVTVDSAGNTIWNAVGTGGGSTGHYFRVNGANVLAVDGNAAVTFGGAVSGITTLSTTNNITATNALGVTLTLNAAGAGTGARVAFQASAVNKWFIAYNYASSGGLEFYEAAAGAMAMFIADTTKAVTFYGAMGGNATWALTQAGALSGITTLAGTGAVSGFTTLVLGSTGTATRFIGGTDASSAVAKGYFGDGTYNTVNDSSIAGMVGVLATTTNSAATGSQYVLDTQIVQSVATTGGSYAGRFVAIATHTSGTVAQMLGGNGAVFLQGNGGTTTNAYGWLSQFVVGTGATVTNLYGARVNAPSNSGTITNLYGLFIGDITAGATINRAIKTGLGAVEFGDTLAVLGDLAINTNKFVVTAATGATEVRGVLTINQAGTRSWTFDQTATSGSLTLASGDSLGTFKVQIPTLFNSVINTKGYTVATLPAGTLGDVAHATDLLAPAFLAVAVGGGAVKGLVFYNGAAWVAA